MGPKALSEDGNEKVLNYSRSILDNDRQKQLSEQLAELAGETDPAPLLFRIAKELVISPLEKAYIGKI